MANKRASGADLGGGSGKTRVDGPAAIRSAADANTLVTEAEPLPAPPSLPPRKATFEMISMKSPAQLAAEKAAAAPTRRVQLRSLAEAGRPYPTPPGGLGYLAPPRDPTRPPRRDGTGLYALKLAAAALAIALGIAAVMWFVALR